MFRKTVLLGVAMLTIGTVAFAQAQDQGGRRGGGRRGMGAMMRAGGPMMTLRLLENEKVQKDLELVPEQKEKLDALQKDLRDNMRKNMEAMRDLSEEERAKKMDQQTEELQAKLKEILLPKQQDRIKEIRIQVAGGAAVLDPELQKELNITDEQKEKLKTTQEEWGKKLRESMSSGDRSDFPKKMQEARKDLDEQLMKILTDEQKEKLEKMKGEKIDIDPATLMGPPPGGGRGRNRPAPSN
jgi:hypothetical protein